MVEFVVGAASLGIGVLLGALAVILGHRLGYSGRLDLNVPTETDMVLRTDMQDAIDEIQSMDSTAREAKDLVGRWEEFANGGVAHDADKDGTVVY